MGIDYKKLLQACSSESLPLATIGLIEGIYTDFFESDICNKKLTDMKELADYALVLNKVTDSVWSVLRSFKELHEQTK